MQDGSEAAVEEGSCVAPCDFRCLACPMHLSPLPHTRRCVPPGAACVSGPAVRLRAHRAHTVGCLGAETTLSGSPSLAQLVHTPGRRANPEPCVAHGPCSCSSCCAAAQCLLGRCITGWTSHCCVVLEPCGSQPLLCSQHHLVFGCAVVCMLRLMFLV
jgi:hypothetical protein